MAKEAFALAWRQVRVSEEGGKGILGGGNHLGPGRKHGDNTSSLAVAGGRG